MKNTALSVIAVVGLALKPGTAHAGDEGWAALGGFIGGAIFSNIANQRGDSDRYHYDNGITRGNHSAVTVVVGNDGRRGYYKYQQVKRWVPGYHAYRRDECGRQIKVWHNGYYTHDRVRVWVPTGGHHYDRGYGRSDRYSGRHSHNSGRTVCEINHATSRHDRY